MSSHLQLTSAIATRRNETINNSVLNATPTGSTDTAVLRMNVAAAVPIGGRSINEVNSAANGTVLTISSSGVFQVDLELAFTGAVAVQAGIGFNMAAAPIVADPVFGTDGVIKAADMLMVATSTQAISFSTYIVVTAAQAAAGATLRFLATNSAGAAPVGIVAASVAYRVRKMFNVPF